MIIQVKYSRFPFWKIVFGIQCNQSAFRHSIYDRVAHNDQSVKLTNNAGVLFATSVKAMSRFELLRLREASVACAIASATEHRARPERREEQVLNEFL